MLSVNSGNLISIKEPSNGARQAIYGLKFSKVKRRFWEIDFEMWISVKYEKT